MYVCMGVFVCVGVWVCVNVPYEYCGVCINAMYTSDRYISNGYHLTELCYALING